MKSKDCNSGSANEIDVLAQLPTMERDQLLRLWGDVVKSSAPAAISRQLLERGLAYALQERQFGGLSNRLRKDLQKIGHSGDQRNAGKATIGQSESKDNPVKTKVEGGSVKLATAKLKGKSPATVSLRPGMRLVREWQGRSHVVDVRDDGFQWNDKVYRSLSALACAMTGAKWSGPRFFGL